MNGSTHKRNDLFSSRRVRPAVPANIMETLGGEFSKHELQTLGRLGTLVQVGSGRELIVESQTGSEVFVLLSGTADVIRGDEVLATIGSGAVFGEAALINSEPRGATVVARTALSVFVLNPQEFKSLMATCPRLDRSIRDLAARRQAEQ